MKPHVRNGKRAKAKRVETAIKRTGGSDVCGECKLYGPSNHDNLHKAKTLADCDCEVKGLRPADKRATGGNSEKGY